MTFRQKPRLTYNGLTVVLRNPSRFDTKHGRLLSATGGSLFSDCLAPDYNIHQCDLRVKEDKDPLLAGTKCVALLGEEAAQEWLNNKTNTINEIRGSVYNIDGVPHIASYFPQDAADPKDWESTHNVEYTREEDDDDDKSPVDEKRRHGRTKHRNYRFWLGKDIHKCKLILKGMQPSNPIPNPEYIIYPTVATIVDKLKNTHDQDLFFDIETDVFNNILCFSFSIGMEPIIYCVPCLNHNYDWAYHNLPQIYSALAIAIWNNCVVAHNGANFDYYVLAKKYKIAINQVKDTMLQQHRCYPEAEKSLGHCLPAYGIIDTVCGRKPIKTLLDKKDFYVWSWKDNNPWPAKVKRVFKTRENAELVRIKCWRRGNSQTGPILFQIDCTPDHKFLRKNGQWIEACNLKCGMRLTKVRIHYGKEYNQYDRIIYTTKAGIDIRYRAHQYIYKCLHPEDKQTRLDDIHHKDEDKWNNEPINLEKLSLYAHQSHNKSGGVSFTSPYKNKFFNLTSNQFEDVPIEKIKELYNSGMSQAEIGAILGCSQGAIHFIMEKNNIKTRTPQEGQSLYYAKKNNCTVISIENLPNKEDVYCLEVEDTNCFSSNGVIIHNCTSLWTFEPFHKDEGDGGYYTAEDVRAKLLYCGKDVYTMKLIHYAQLAHAKRIPGLQESFDQVNSAIKPYLTTTFTGINYDAQKVREIIAENDAAMMQYIRILNWFVGEKTISELRKRFKSSLPGSNPQCCIYFHEKLGYPIVGRGKEKKDGTRNPSLAKKNLFKLKLKHDNPVIDLIIAYRETQKESGSLKFNPLYADSSGTDTGITQNLQSSDIREAESTRCKPQHSEVATN